MKLMMMVVVVMMTMMMMMMMHDLNNNVILYTHSCLVFVMKQSKINDIYNNGFERGKKN